MKTIYAACVGLVLGVLGCNPTPAPAPNPDASATVTAAPPSDPETALPPSTKPFVAKVDARTPAQIAVAACRRADGAWACPSVKASVMAGGAAPIPPPSWSVPNWYLDFANSSGCANDGNSGTSATCSGAGVGPLLTIGQLYARWGVYGGIMQFMDDLIIHGSMSVEQGSVVSAKNVHLPSGISSVQPGSAIALRVGVAAGCLWGAGGLEVLQGGTVVNKLGGGTWANNVLLNSLLLTSNGLTTGCAPYDGGAGNSPPCGITVTSAAIDQYGSLTDIVGGGARFTN